MVMAEMFRSAPNQSRFTRLSLEQLEARDCPALITLHAAVNESLHEVTLTGQLTEGVVGNVAVHFSGAVIGSTVTDSNGYFTFATTEASLGTVYAVGIDQGVEITDSISAEITSNRPGVIITSVTSEYNVFWTITGYVMDEHTEGLVLQFGGAAQGVSVVIGEDGTFVVTCYIEQTQAGNVIIEAMTTDWWGQESNVALAYMF
jgi:hypothetical protein